MSGVVLNNGFDLQKFLKFVRNTAESNRMTAAMGGRMDDGGAAALEAQIEAFQAGWNRMIPTGWNKMLAEYNRINDPEYETYVRLKEKFEKQT